MTLEEFKNKYDGAPLMLCEVAEEASNVTDDLRLACASKLYLEAEKHLFQELERINFEIG